MISDIQRQANRANALKSTGPRTAEGKARVAANALKHGLVSELRILPGLEDAGQWQYHLEQTLQDMAPEGHLECLLAERIALLLWRMRRAAKYEQEAAAAELENAERRLPGSVFIVSRHEQEQGLSPLEAADKRVEAASERVGFLERLRKQPDGEVVLEASELILTAQDIPNVSFAYGQCLEELDEVAERSRMENRPWTAKEVRSALGVLAKCGGVSFDQFLEKLTAPAKKDLARTERERSVLNSTLDQYRRLSLLPEEKELAKIIRYEAHLERMLSKAMHEFQRLQAARLGRPGPLPVAVDVTVSGQDQGV